jgi:hypothetical protein
MFRVTTLGLLLALMLGAAGCSNPSAVEGKVEVNSPKEYQRKDRHVFKPQSTAPRK